MGRKIICVEFGCNYPEGECAGTCQRNTVVASNGNDGAHYDVVNHPPHYTQHPSGVECIQITEHMGFCLGNAVKYIWRADLKHDAIEDLKKAVWYIQREIERRSKQ